METIFLSSNNSLPGGRKVSIPGTYFKTDLSYVSTVGVSRSRILISDGDIISPFHCPDGNKATKVFILWGKVTQMGVCTDQDWLNPIWGKQHPSFPGLWIVVTRGLDQGDAQFKIVTTRRSTNDLLWEPEEFMNKTIKLEEGPQIICSQWGSDSAEAFDIPEYTPEPSDVHGNAEDDSEGKDSKILEEKTDNVSVDNADDVSDGEGLEMASTVREDETSEREATVREDETSEKIDADSTDEADDAAVQVVTYNEGTTIFILRGKVTRMGVCTDREWSKPIWGTQHPSSPGLWTVTTCGLQGDVEFKIVTTRRTSNQLLWEPEPFVNKAIKLEEGPQLICSEWGSDSAEVFDVPEDKPEPIDVNENVEDVSESKDIESAETLEEKTNTFDARTNEAMMDAGITDAGDKVMMEAPSITNDEIQCTDDKTTEFIKKDMHTDEKSGQIQNDSFYETTLLSSVSDTEYTSMENEADELFIKQTFLGQDNDMHIKQDNQILTKKRRGFFQGILRRFRRKINF